MSGATDLHAELVSAILRARHPDVAAKLAPLRLPLGFSPKLMTGVSRVEFFHAGRVICYQPAEDGRRALIVAVQETLFSTLNELISLDPVTGICVETAEAAGREVVDLCAVDLLTQQVGTRLGIGTVLGRDAIDDVRFDGGALRPRRPALRLATRACGLGFHPRLDGCRLHPRRPRPPGHDADRQAESRSGALPWHWPSEWSAPSAVRSPGRTCG